MIPPTLPPPPPPVVVVDASDPLRDAVDYHAAMTALAERAADAEASRSTDRAPTDVTGVMACIRAHESGGNYQAVNTSSGAAGAYQLMPEYADDWAVRYGYPEWADDPVTAWPPAVQDAVALGLYRATDGRAWSDFTTYDCPWGTP